jgi:hypothetical protein
LSALRLKRRDLTPAQRIDVTSKLIEIMRRRAKERQAAGQERDRDARWSRVNSPETNIVPFPADSAQVRDEIAKQTGLSPRTASDAITVKEVAAGALPRHRGRSAAST